MHVKLTQLQILMGRDGHHHAHGAVGPPRCVGLLEIQTLPLSVSTSHQARLVPAIPLSLKDEEARQCLLIPSAWDERFASSAEYGLGHVPTKATSEVVRSSPGSKTAGERDDAGSLKYLVLQCGLSGLGYKVVERVRRTTNYQGETVQRGTRDTPNSIGAEKRRSRG
jgi:hypothetical protein